MTSSMVSTGKTRKKPYVLCVTSHKGGTGRTTLACALAWLWGNRGLKVTLVDADPVRATGLIAAGRSGVCPWDNVNLVIARGGSNKIPPGQDVVIIDSPPATEPLAQSVFAQAHGVVVCTLADSLSLVTLPKATDAISLAMESNDRLELLGIAVNIFATNDLAQTRALTQLRSTGGLFLEPAIPVRSEIREWPSKPGTSLPSGPGLTAFRQLADLLRDSIAAAGWNQFANTRRGENHAFAVSR